MFWTSPSNLALLNYVLAFSLGQTKLGLSAGPWSTSWQELAKHWPPLGKRPLGVRDCAKSVPRLRRWVRPIFEGMLVVLSGEKETKRDASQFGVAFGDKSVMPLP